MRTKTKNKVFNLCLSVLICVLLIFVFSISAYAETLEEIRVIKISPQDERAVIKTSDRKLQIIKVGDVIRVENSYQHSAVSGQERSAQRSDVSIQHSVLRVIEITTGRVVFEGMTDMGVETVIIRVEDGKQRVERIRKAGEEQPLLYAPIHEGGNRRKGNSFQ